METPRLEEVLREVAAVQLQRHPARARLGTGIQGNELLYKGGPPVMFVGL